MRQICRRISPKLTTPKLKLDTRPYSSWRPRASPKICYRRARIDTPKATYLPLKFILSSDFGHLIWKCWEVQNFKTCKKDTEISKFLWTSSTDFLTGDAFPPPPPAFDAHARSITHLQSAMPLWMLIAGEMTLHIASTTEVKSGWDSTGNRQFIQKNNFWNNVDWLTLLHPCLQSVACIFYFLICSIWWKFDNDIDNIVSDVASSQVTDQTVVPSYRVRCKLYFGAASFLLSTTQTTEQWFWTLTNGFEKCRN